MIADEVEHRALLESRDFVVDRPIPKMEDEPRVHVRAARNVDLVANGDHLAVSRLKQQEAVH